MRSETHSPAHKHTKLIPINLPLDIVNLFLCHTRIFLPDRQRLLTITTSSSLPHVCKPSRPHTTPQRSSTTAHKQLVRLHRCSTPSQSCSQATEPVNQSSNSQSFSALYWISIISATTYAFSHLSTPSNWSHLNDALGYLGTQSAHHLKQPNSPIL